MINSIYIKQLELGMMANFSYIIGDKKSGDAVVIDPSEETDIILKEASKNGLTLKAVLLTHGHYDHVGGIQKLNLPTYLSKAEPPLYTPKYKEFLRTTDQQKIAVGSITIECLHTPGHTPGCQCFYVEGNLFTGDILFIDAIGRTDFPGGDAETLFKSLQRIKQLSDGIIIWPGHNYGAVTHATLGELKKTNPFLVARSFDDF